MSLGIKKSRELVDDLVFGDPDDRHFNDPVMEGTHAGRFNVYNCQVVVKHNILYSTPLLTPGGWKFFNGQIFFSISLINLSIPKFSFTEMNWGEKSSYLLLISVNIFLPSPEWASTLLKT